MQTAHIQHFNQTSKVELTSLFPIGNYETMARSPYIPNRQL